MPNPSRGITAMGTACRIVSIHAYLLRITPQVGGTTVKSTRAFRDPRLLPLGLETVLLAAAEDLILVMSKDGPDVRLPMADARVACLRGVQVGKERSGTHRRVDGYDRSMGARFCIERKLNLSRTVREIHVVECSLEIDNGSRNPAKEGSKHF